MEALFHCHGDFNDRRRIRSKVFLDFRVGSQLRPLNAQLLDENIENRLSVFIRWNIVHSGFTLLRDAKLDSLITAYYITAKSCFQKSLSKAGFCWTASHHCWRWVPPAAL